MSNDFPIAGSFNPTTDMSIERLFDAESDTSAQEPTGLGVANAIQISFGPAIGDSSDPVQIDANGTVTFNQGGTYRIKVALEFGREGASGTSVLLFRVRVNGVQAGRSISTSLPNSNASQYFENDTWLTVPAGVVLRFDVMRDASGTDFGGLFGLAPTVDGGNEWNDSPSAMIRMERWT